MDNIYVKPSACRQPDDILSELLVLQAQGGCEAALCQLVEIWTPKLNARAVRLTRDPDAALEVVQETWIGIARGLRSLKDPARFAPWSLRIVHHKAADWIKQRTKQRALESHLHENATEQESEAREDLSQEITIAIGHLDRRLQDVVYLFYMDNCTVEQIAVVLQIPPGTVKTRLARARTKLKHLLERSTQ